MIKVQHHNAHFAAVLAENNLLKTEDPVLGIIWDGTGYGDDDQIWGGEFFIYDDGEMQRVAHLDYFPQLLGDKMNREPRLSALSLLRNIPAAQQQLQKNYSEKEWNYYQQLIKRPAELLTSSMGRFLDGIASILNICQINSYEGEAAMKMEAVARSYTDNLDDYYPLVQRNNRLDHSFFLQEILNDLKNEIPVNQIARKVFYSLAKSISPISEYYCINHLAFSGGVFQNALLTDMINELLAEEKQLYRHRELSPNDECIGFGQLAYYHILQKRKSVLKNHESIFYNE